MFVNCSIYTQSRPVVSDIGGAYEVTFPIDPDAGSFAPTLRVEAGDSTSVMPDIVLRPDILSLAIGHGDQRVTVLPDGLVAYHKLDLLMQDSPRHEGARLCLGSISVTVTSTERTMVSGDGFCLAIERDGRVRAVPGIAPQANPSPQAAPRPAGEAEKIVQLRQIAEADCP